MLIGHIPAGYMFSRMMRERFPARGDTPYLMPVGLCASVLPDIDLIYFYLFSDHQQMHHAFGPHIPVFWVMVLFGGYLVVRSFGLPLEGFWFALVGGNIFLHLLLDTIAGRIRWFFPFSAKALTLWEVPARYDWWVWSMVLDPSFFLEIGLVVATVYVLARASGKADLSTGGSGCLLLGGVMAAGGSAVVSALLLSFVAMFQGGPQTGRGHALPAALMLGVFFLGIVQWAWILPVFYRAVRAGERSLAWGLIIGGAVFCLGHRFWVLSLAL